jgi:hypothetical protein
MIKIRFEDDLISRICTQISNEALMKSHYHLNQNRLGHYSKTNEKTKQQFIFIHSRYESKKLIKKLNLTNSHPDYDVKES